MLTQQGKEEAAQPAQYAEAHRRIASRMSLLKVMDVSLWNRTLVSLNKAFQLNTLAIELDGNLLFDVIYANTFCPHLSKASGQNGSSACRMNHSDVIEIARRTRSVVVRSCENGLSRILIPVYFRGLLLGCIGGCGAFLGGSAVPEVEIAQLANRIGIPPNDLLKEARESVVRLTQTTVDTYVGLLEHRLKSRL